MRDTQRYDHDHPSNKETFLAREPGVVCLTHDKKIIMQDWLTIHFPVGKLNNQPPTTKQHTRQFEAMLGKVTSY